MIRSLGALAGLTLAAFNAVPTVAAAQEAAQDIVIVESDAPLPLEPEATNPSKRRSIGHGRIITNDLLGDTQDRWRTGSATLSWAWARSEGAIPTSFGDLLELRLHGEVVAPESLLRYRPKDRPIGGLTVLSLYTHYDIRGTETSIGGELAMTGGQTGLIDFQSWLHDQFNVPRAAPGIVANQLANEFYGGAVVEMGRPVGLGSKVWTRPFVEARYGVEDLVRVGFDLSFGQLNYGAVMGRDSVSGQRYRIGGTGDTGVSFTLGADAAYVADSALMPTGTVKIEDMRYRYRAGFNWQREEGLSGFYGLTYLSEEFRGQNEGQVVGSLRLQMKF